MGYRQRHPYLMQSVYIIQTKARGMFHSKSIAAKVIQLPFTVNGHELYAWHCPRCKRFLYTIKSTSIRYCSNCG